MQFPSRIRPAEISDSDSIKDFLEQNIFLHRHLDWQEPLYWLRKQPFFLLENGTKLEALLSFATGPDEIAWARTFAVSPSVPISFAWDKLFSATLDGFRLHPPQLLAAVSLFEWFTKLLRQSGFQYKQDIVTFYFSRPLSPQKLAIDNCVPRKMVDADLHEIEDLDRAAFEPIWQTPLAGLSAAFAESFYSTVMMHQNNIVAYLIATEKNNNAHLARIAVHPHFQGHGIASSLIMDFLKFCKTSAIQEITLNTQSDNQQSISLYKNLGFIPSNNTYPVFVYPMQ